MSKRTTVSKEKLAALMQVAAEVRAYIEGGSRDLGGVDEAMGKLYRAGVTPEELDDVLE